MANVTRSKKMCAPLSSLPRERASARWILLLVSVVVVQARGPGNIVAQRRRAAARGSHQHALERRSYQALPSSGRRTLQDVQEIRYSYYAYGGMKDKEGHYSPFEGMTAKGAKSAKTAMNMSKGDQHGKMMMSTGKGDDDDYYSGYDDDHYYGADDYYGNDDLYVPPPPVDKGSGKGKGGHEYPLADDDDYYNADDYVDDAYKSTGKMSSGKGKGGHEYPLKPSPSYKGKTTDDPEDDSLHDDDYYYDDDNYYGTDDNVCVATPAGNDCCVCQCCHEIKPTHPTVLPPKPITKGKDVNFFKGSSMTKGASKPKGKGRNLAPYHYPTKSTDTTCYCTCDESCLTPPPTPPPKVYTPPPYIPPVPVHTPPPSPPYHPPAPAPPPKSKKSSKKGEGPPSTSKMTSKSNKSGKKDATSDGTAPRTSEEEEEEAAEEMAGRGDVTESDNPPFESSYSRRNFRFPWLLLAIFGACVSLYFLKKRREPHPQDGMSVSV